MKPAWEYTNHAREIARRWGIRMIEDSGMAPHEAKASPASRTVVHSPINDEESYVSSMHELGHVISPVGYIRGPGQEKPKNDLENVTIQIVEEEAAWAWAKENAIEWTTTMDRVMVTSLQTYLDAKQAIERGETAGPMAQLFGLIDGLFGGQMGPAGAGVPQRPVDPHAGSRMAPTHARTASMIVKSIKEVSDGSSRVRLEGRRR